MNHLREFVILRWRHVFYGLLAVTLLFNGVVGIVAAMLGTLVIGFGIGVMVIASAIAEDYNRMRRRIEQIERKHRRMIESARERAKGRAV